MDILERYLPLYVQMIDPSLAGPAEPYALKVFSALNSLGVIAVRPILLAIAGLPNEQEGIESVLRLVVRRIVAGNLGTGNVERRFGEAARAIDTTKKWEALDDDLGDLNPTRNDFVEQLRKRSFNKGTLAFVRQSIVQRTIAPDDEGTLHFIIPRQAPENVEMTEEQRSFWSATIGNTFLANVTRRPKGASDWDGFVDFLLPHAVTGEWVQELRAHDEWNAEAIEEVGSALASAAGEIWF